jgi:hypothetical protein
MTLRVPLAALAALFSFALAAQNSAVGQDKDADKEQAKKAKAAAVENLKKCKIDKPTVIETDRFIVAGSIPEAKAKALGEVLEKTLKVARTAAKYDEKDAAWKGKLTVYFLPEGDEFKAFMRRVLQTPPESTYVDLRADFPLIVDPVDLPGKPTDADLYAATAARVAGELLQAKGTATQMIPSWLRDGFGRVCAMRAEGLTSTRYTKYKAAARAAILNPKGGKLPVPADVWSEEKTTTGELLANSMAEFLAFGPKAADFGKFIEALRPSENVATPTVSAQGFPALGWKDDMVADLSWKTWVQKGK